MDATQVPAGYKVTDLGVLPEDWAVNKLGKHVSFRTGPFGSALHKSDYVTGGIPVVNPMQIVAGELVPTLEMAISKAAALQLNDFLLSTGDIVIGRRGEMGRCAVVQEQHHGWLCGTGSMIIRVSKSIDARFLQRILSSPPIIAAIESTSVGTTMINLNQSVLGHLQIPLPPLAEQQAIAAALGEMDALLAAQRARLAKQRAVKQGLLQGLLSGEKRLPGFAGEWEVKRLGELFSILPTASNSRADLEQEGEVAYLHYGDIHTKYDLFLDCTTAHLPYLRKEKVNARATLLRNGDLVIADASEDYEGIGKGVEITGIDGRKVVAGLHTMLLRATSNLTAEGYRGYMLLYPATRQHLQNMATGVSVYGITKANLKNTPVYLPPTDEQRAIAAVLSTTDAHLAALEAEHAKTQQLKQGLMQQLLTGKLRLV